jgi:hypothetical protein
MIRRGCSGSPDNLRPVALVHGVRRNGLAMALLHKSGDGWASPFRGQTYPATSVTGVPSAVKPFRAATRICASAT